MGVEVTVRSSGGNTSEIYGDTDGINDYIEQGGTSVIESDQFVKGKFSIGEKLILRDGANLTIKEERDDI